MENIPQVLRELWEECKKDKICVKSRHASLILKNVFRFDKIVEGLMHLMMHLGWLGG